jgi:hypothetical protein
MPWGKDQKPRWFSLARPCVVLTIGYSVVWYFLSLEPLWTRSIGSMITDPVHAATLVILVSSGVFFFFMTPRRWHPLASHLMTSAPRMAGNDDVGTTSRQKLSLLLYAQWAAGQGCSSLPVAIRFSAMRIFPLAFVLGLCAAGCSSQSAEEACISSGGQCVLGGTSTCTNVGASCNTSPPNPGGAFCCYAFADGGDDGG